MTRALNFVVIPQQREVVNKTKGYLVGQPTILMAKVKHAFKVMCLLAVLTYSTAACVAVEGGERVSAFITVAQSDSPAQAVRHNNDF